MLFEFNCLLLHVQGGWAFAAEDQRQDILAFAMEAVELLRARCPYSLAHFMLRVDVMQRADGQLIVNEFESLEAFISGPVLLEEAADRWLVEFWLSLLTSAI